MKKKTTVTSKRETHIVLLSHREVAFLESLWLESGMGRGDLISRFIRLALYVENCGVKLDVPSLPKDLAFTQVRVKLPRGSWEAFVRLAERWGLSENDAARLTVHFAHEHLRKTKHGKVISVNLFSQLSLFGGRAKQNELALIV